MIEGTFDSRTLANMNVALDRVCERAVNGESHSVRKRVARQIIKCASSGKTTLGDLTAAGQRALRPRGCSVQIARENFRGYGATGSPDQLWRE